MIGHVGSRAGALIDGQLPATFAERLWRHVHGCPTCRAEVEREGWVKTQLAGLALCRPTAPAAIWRRAIDTSPAAASSSWKTRRPARW